jgi:hypothetical protein
MKALQIVDASEMVSPSAREDWHKWTARLTESQSPIHEENVLQDTVGAVACDSQGNLASGVSRYFFCLFRKIFLIAVRSVDSGGLLLKLPGRVGEVIASLSNTTLILTINFITRRLSLDLAAGLNKRALMGWLAVCLVS